LFKKLHRDTEENPTRYKANVTGHTSF